MGTEAGRCERCGADIGAAGAHECPAATPSAAGTALPTPTPVGVTSQPLEFEAEECLARGDAARALMLASRALAQRPENLTLRSLVERARGLVLRGRRGERLERRLREAHEMLEQGDLASAERIAGSALKLVPDHEPAVALYERVKELRSALPAAEAEAERELSTLNATQARRAAASARTLLAAGNERGALIVVRRALRHAPDDADLAALFAEIQSRLSQAAATEASLRERVEQARARLTSGEIVKARDLLRGVLHQSPGFAPALALMQEVRAVLRGGGLTPVPSATTTVAKPTPLPVSEVVWARRPPAGSRRAAGSGAGRAFVRGLMMTVLTIAVLGGLAGGGTWLWRRSGLEWPSAPVPQQTPSSVDLEPIADEEPELRSAVAAVLRRYASALERRDALALRQARPDLSADGRRALLAMLEGATGLSVALRALNVEVDGEAAVLTVERTFNASDTTQPLPPPVEETLRLVLVDGQWRQQ